ncbi:unnamed protein product [Protopolystoma xenopodis]|uniref:Uncharacterized protein n=1 Tax=Protopolystoma xenopodis TaxID=117903 RepID=A0A3S5A9J1_9PLAT|nr:unnamed protein product [Protopolystoma xenopodis]
MFIYVTGLPVTPNEATSPKTNASLHEHSFTENSFKKAQREEKATDLLEAFTIFEEPFAAGSTFPTRPKIQSLLPKAPSHPPPLTLQSMTQPAPSSLIRTVAHASNFESNTPLQTYSSSPAHVLKTSTPPSLSPARIPNGIIPLVTPSNRKTMALVDWQPSLTELKTQARQLPSNMPLHTPQSQPHLPSKITTLPNSLVAPQQLSRSTEKINFPSYVPNHFSSPVSQMQFDPPNSLDPAMYSNLVSLIPFSPPLPTLHPLPLSQIDIDGVQTPVYTIQSYDYKDLIPEIDALLSSQYRFK